MGALKLENKWVLAAGSCISFLGFLDTHLLIPVIAIYASGLGAGVGAVGVIVGLYSILNTPANILFGRFVDRTGAKVPLVAGLLGDAISMVLYAFSRTPFHMALVRVLHGISGALVGPSTMSIIANYSARERKGRSMSFYGMALASASLVGYPVSGLIASRLGFSALFFSGALLVGIGFILSLALPRNGAEQKAMSSVPARKSLQQIGDLLSRRGLLTSYAATFTQYFTFGAVVTLLPLRLERLGMGTFEVGMLLAVFSAVFVLSQFPSGVLSDKVGRMGPIVGGLLCVILSLFMLPFLSGFSLLAVVMGLYGIGYGLLFPSISALIADNTAVEERGLATGLFHALLTAGVAVGAPVMGWVSSLTSIEAGLATTAVLALVTLSVIVVFLKSWDMHAFGL